MVVDTKFCNTIALSMAWKDDTEEDHNRRLKNLQYAFKYIHPSKHVEYAFCVWVGTRHETPTRAVKEFCIRRASKSKAPSPYTIVDPNFWKIPNTYEVFVFREQFFVLIAELTGYSIFNRAPQILKKIYKGTCSFEDFCELFTDEYTESLSGAEKATLFKRISKDYPSAIPYYWCSSIANVALNYSSALPNQELTINVEEVFVHGFHEIHGFTEKGHTSFLHLSEDEFESAKKIGKKEHIQKMDMEYYAHLRSVEENRIRLLECKQSRNNKHKPRKRN